MIVDAEEGIEVSVIKRQDFKAETEEAGRTLAEALSKIGYEVQGVGDHFVAGTCEACGKIIYDNDEYGMSEEGDYMHNECVDA